jgi:hypothetical protein
MTLNKCNRRQLLQIGLKGLAAVQLGSLASCLAPQKVSGFHVFWLHWEGAPMRALFDLWIDPFAQYDHVRPLTQQRKATFNHHKVSIPELWFKNDRPSPLLSNLISIRGLSTKSPHLKQCRMEWFSHDLFSEIHNESSSISFKWISAQQNLAKSYRQILGPRNEVTIEDKGPLSFLDQWHQEIKGLQNNPEKLGVQLAVENRFKDGGYFENISTLSDKDIQEQQQYFHQLILGLESFVDHLQQRGLYKKSLILLTSDRSRVPTQRQPVLETETLWQGLNISLISGALKGPMVLGNLLKEHPRYSETYPGTWGHGLSQWSPADVHQLLADLSWSTGYTESKSWVSQNPWIDLKPYHGLYIKQGPGLIINS